ncbi:MAG: hypothetical protein CVV44_17115 [Spirochaetae bacterium HGW-Spirochaetae-1]|nr:MAG: hypothetical protein CVV44_17115 [Spirochaetae bacterium HGW-Spirochaetae-1]
MSIIKKNSHTVKADNTMKIKNTRTTILAALAAILLLIFPAGKLLPQFLYEENNEPGKEEPVEKPVSQYPPYMAYNIKAVPVQNIPNAIMITWEMDPEYIDDFIVARSAQVIDTREKAMGAQTVKVVSSKDKGVVIDPNMVQGVYFYAVIANKIITREKIELMENVNFTSVPVVISPPQEKTVREEVTGIQARLLGNTLAHISWKPIQEKGFTYTVYRSTAILDSADRLKKAEKIAIVPDSSQYLDQGLLREGTYYYAVTFAYLKGDENLILKAGENYTTEGLYAGGEKSKTPDYFKILSIRAVARKDNVIISWDYSGLKGNRFFRLYRTERNITKTAEITEDDVIDDVDITLGSFIDRNLKSGIYYYGLAPYEDSVYKDFEVVSGINIMSNPLAVAGVKKAEPEKEISLVPIVPDKSGETGAIEKDQTESGTLDEILRRTFFAGEYKYAIKELQRVIKTTDNDMDRAKARLFIGRSYIELHQYEEAVKYLVLKDVEKYFRREAFFWRDFAFLQIK